MCVTRLWTVHVAVILAVGSQYLHLNLMLSSRFQDFLRYLAEVLGLVLEKFYKTSFNCNVNYVVFNPVGISWFAPFSSPKSLESILSDLSCHHCFNKNK